MHSDRKLTDAGVVSAESGMLTDLAGIWHACFGDEEEDIRYFFTFFKGDVKTIALVEEGRAVSMLCMLPASLRTQNGECPVNYIYAVGTLPSCRGRGYSKRVMDCALAEAKQRKEGVFLVPAGESLKSFYRQQGFGKFGREERILLRQRESAELLLSGEEKRKQAGYELTAVSPREYTALRDAAFTRPGYIRWNGKTVCYALSQYERAGGRCCKLCLDGREYGIAYRRDAGRLLFEEITADTSEAALIAALIMEREDVREGELKRSSYTMGKDMPDAGEGFFNLVLDC